ncbi:RHS repeat-associated core domain-containing protein [Sorangium sp. So ce119]|uniref:RHS repeat-associated core domain-containing protein n=1 Tax=Sorangium sp. So ce119 TaxID=3133279 RepID=UPI003F63A5D5
MDVSDADDILTTWEYDALGRVTKLTTPSDQEDIGQNFVETLTTYGFGLDQEGVLRFRTTVTEPDGGMTVQHRDVMDRVVEMIERANPADGTPIVTRYRYNPVSDLVQVEDAHGNVTTATFDTLGRMVSLNSPDAGLIEWEYDASGNQRTWAFRGATREIIWNEENLASEIKLFNQTRSKNLYDGEGQRAVSKHDVVGQEETAYISQDLTIRDGRYLTKHVYAGGTQLASKMDSAWLNHPPTLYFHTDHLRSTQYSSNEEQTLIQHNEYFPSGELWRDETDSRYELARRYTFSGKELDIGTGLHYFGARYYDGRQSQWLSPDPMVAQYFSGQPALGVYAPVNLSLYAYAGNNPTNNVDRTGQYFESVWDGISLGMGIASLVDNIAQRKWGSAAIDAGGVILDGVAMALPVVPGGAGAAIQGARAADKLNDMRKAVDSGADAAKVVAQHGDEAADVGRRMDDVADLGKQADTCSGSGCGGKGVCFVAGTEVTTSSGLVPIETVSVGDRVLTSDGRSETLVDESWRLVELEMPIRAGARDTIQIRLLRPPSWLAAHGVAEGRTVWLAYEEISLAGEALVRHLGPAPPIAAVPGRVVLSTINQTANDIVRLRFRGEGEVIEATASHRFYSVDRGDWARADNLKTGEHVRTASGTLAVSGVDVLPSVQRVFNLEVESEHEYFVSELRVLSHNTEPCGGGAARGAPKAVNLPAWRSVGIDTAHIAERHIPGGPLTSGRTVFPEHMSTKSVERAVRQAYRYGQKVGGQGERVLMRGQYDSITIEMWVNTTTKTIETAYPVF